MEPSLRFCISTENLLVVDGGKNGEVGSSMESGRGMRAARAGDQRRQAAKAFRKMRDSWIRAGNTAQFEEAVEANNERLKT
jgi:hypothetical protein